MFVYLLYHENTNHCYIGSTNEFVKRFQEHNSSGGWRAIMVLETRKHKDICKRWKESKMDLHTMVLKGLKLSYNYQTNIYLDYDDFFIYKENTHYKLPKRVWDVALKVR